MKRCNQCMELIGENQICCHCGYDLRQRQAIPHALPAGTILQGKYLIGNVLGQGGFGITYIGFDMILEVKVAIKEYYVSSAASRVGLQNQQIYWMSDPGDMNHFITEARRMAKLDKMPEIAHVRDIFYANKTAYIIMEYVEGVSLERYLRRNGVMCYDQTVRLMLPVIEALDRVHQEGLVHRDISPDNLMMEPNGKLRILDLGAAGDLSRNNAQATQMVARHGFSPYEQYLGQEKIGPYTDVYAVCATIYYCCTGKLLPDAMRRMEQYVRTRRNDLEFDPVLPPDAVKVLRRGLALETKDRIPTMAVLAEQLQKTVAVIPAAGKVGLGRKDKIKGIGSQFKSDLRTSWEETQVEEVSYMPSAPWEAKKPEPYQVSQRNETMPNPVTVNPVYRNGEQTANSEAPPKNLFAKYKKPLLAGIAALVMVIGIAAFGGREKQPEEETLQVHQNASERSEGIESTEKDTQPSTEETQVPLEISSSLNLLDVELGATESIQIFSGHDAGEIVWISSDPAVAEISEDGTVTAMGYGTAKITAQYQQEVATCSVSVSLKANVQCTYQDNDTGVTIIGFEGELPEKMALPREIDGKTVTEIGEYAFEGCSGLTSVIIPDSVTVIGGYAFVGCAGLTTVTIPNSVTEIREYAFWACDGLTTATIPNSVTQIGESAFNGCRGLTSVTIPESVTSISLHAFEGCTSLTSVVIPDSVTLIGEYAFAGCSSLTAVTIPGGVTVIGISAFAGCTSLTTVTIPDGVTKIELSAFEGCTSLTAVTIPDSVTEIGESAFEGCTSLTAVTIPDSVTKIEESTFDGCTSLTAVTIPDSVKRIEGSAFNYCTDLTAVTIPDSVYYIGELAFFECVSLSDVIVPDSVTTINYSAFLKTPWFNSQKSDFFICGDGVLLKYNGSDVDVDIPSGVKYVSNAFVLNSGIHSVTIPETVTRIAPFAFSGCENLTSVSIPDSVEWIRAYTFSECTSLTAVTIPGSVTKIEGYAFSECTSLTAVTIPDSVEEIGYDAFKGCTSLATITIPDSVTSIGESAFEGCTSLKRIAIPNGVTTIPENLLYGCTNLVDVTIPDTVTKIGKGAFLGCDKLKRVVLPANCRLGTHPVVVLAQEDVFPETCTVSYKTTS